MDRNPYATVSCHFCNGKGCYCLPPKLGVHEAECVSCDVCEGSGELHKDDLDKMARHYKADEAFKRAFKSAMVVLLVFRFVLGV